jgi:MFS family permease
MENNIPEEKSIKTIFEIEYDEYVSKNSRWNYIVNFLDGSLFWLGYSFIAPAVILPLFVSHFTDSKLLIGAIAMIGSSGWFLPQLFTSNWVEQMPVKKDAPVRLGFYTERVPIFLMPFSAMLALISPGLALISFFFLFTWHSVGAGFVAVAWQDMIAKVIPLRRRGIFMGITTLGGNLTGVLGAVLASYFLDQYVFPTGYTINFSIAAGFILLSWFFLALVREKPMKSTNVPQTNRQYWLNLPSIIRSDRNFMWFLSSQVIGALSGMAWAFLAVYTMQHFSLSDGQTGIFNSYLLIGQSLGNLAGGLLGDRLGYKRALIFGNSCSILALIFTLFAPSATWMGLVFFLRGIALGSLWLASLIVLEFSSPDIRPTYIGVNNTLLGITAMIAPLLGGFLAEVSGYNFLFAIASVMSILSLVVLVFRVRDPRHIHGS